MLSKLFHPRQSTNHRQSPLESRPTSDQPTTNNSPSKLVRKLKILQTALRSSRFNQKDGDRVTETSRKTHRPTPSDESWGNIGPGPFRAQDYEFRQAVPIPASHYIGSDVVLINWTPTNDAPTANRTAHLDSNSPVNPSPTPATSAVTTLAKASSPFDGLFPLPRVGADALANTAHIQVPNVHRAEARGLRANQATNFVIPHAPSTAQRSSTTVATHPTAERQRGHATKADTKIGKCRVESRNKWWEMPGNLRDTKRHLRREAVDFGNPNAPYRNAQEIAHEGHALKRGRANKRRHRPQKFPSPKDLHEPTPCTEDQPIISLESTERGPSSIGPSLFKIDKHDSKFVEMFEVPHELVGRLNDEGNSPCDSTARRPLWITRNPLGSLDITVVLVGRAQELHQADAVEDSEDRDGSLHDSAEQVYASDPSLWFGPIDLSPSQSLDPYHL